MKIPSAIIHTKMSSFSNTFYFTGSIQRLLYYFRFK